MEQVEGADVQFVNDRSVVRWLVAHGKGDAVRRQLSSQKEVELLESFLTIADPTKELARASDRPQTIAAGDLHRTLSYLGLNQKAERHTAVPASPSADLNFKQFVQVVMAEQFGSGAAGARGGSEQVLDVFPIAARAFDVRRMVDRSGALSPASAAKGAKPSGQPAHKRGAAGAHAHARADAAARGGAAKAPQPTTSAARVWDAFNTYEDSYATYKQLRTEYDQRWFGKAPADGGLGERADTTDSAAPDAADDTFEDDGDGGLGGRPASGAISLPGGHRRRRVVGGPMSRSLAALGTPHASAAAPAPAASAGLRVSASAPSLSEAAGAPSRVGRRSARASPASFSAAALHELPRADSIPLLSVHAARRAARSKVLPALEVHDAGAGRERRRGAPDAAPRPAHVTADARYDHAARQEVRARMQAWHDMRESTRDNGPRRATTLRMGRNLHTRERVYLGHLNPLPIGGDGVYEFYA